MLDAVPEWTILTPEMLQTYGTWRCPESTMSTLSSLKIAMTSPASRRLLTSRPVPGTARMWWCTITIFGPRVQFRNSESIQA